MVKVKEKEKKIKVKAYDANSLRSLNFPDNVRHRVGMYFGSKDEPGVTIREKIPSLKIENLMHMILL